MQTVAGRRRVKVAFWWAFWAINLAVVIGFWLQGNMRPLGSGQTALVIFAVARLVGLVAMFSLLTQLVVMSRQSWLEPVFGLDRLAVFHRRNGVIALCLVLLHPILMLTGGMILSGRDAVAQFLFLLNLPFIPLALTAVILLLLTVGTSIYIVRRHLRFETWYVVHLLNYAALFLVVWHQLVLGVSGPLRVYWIAIFVGAMTTMLYWRWLRPVLHMWRYDFRVEKVVAETPTTTNVYIAGENLQYLNAKGGQFVMVRFLTRKLGWQEHPFSLSMLPTNNQLRLTIKQLGDFTNQIPQLKPGTRVMISGPHGAFTHDKQVAQKVLYIAGGIGITPIRALIQERATGAAQGGDAVLLFGNRTIGDTALLTELQQLGAKIKMPIHNVLSEQPGYSGENGIIDTQRIQRLVPDVAERDVFLCGPPPMMAGVRASLKQLGVPDGQVHYERFSLYG